MNHLAHFFLAAPQPALMVGGFLGDYVKGPLKGELPDDLELGIKLHRAIDVFTDQHPRVKQSVARFNKPYRRFAPIICDIAYDHFLAESWQQYAQTSLDEFSERSYQLVLERKNQIPANALASIQRMQAFGALQSYQEPEFINSALISISRRLKRKNPLATGFAQYLQNQQELKQDFLKFMPEAIAFATDWINERL